MPVNVGGRNPAANHSREFINEIQRKVTLAQKRGTLGGAGARVARESLTKDFGGVDFAQRFLDQVSQIGSQQRDAQGGINRAVSLQSETQIGSGDNTRTVTVGGGEAARRLADVGSNLREINFNVERGPSARSTPTRGRSMFDTSAPRRFQNRNQVDTVQRPFVQTQRNLEDQVGQQTRAAEENQNYASDVASAVRPSQRDVRFANEAVLSGRRKRKGGSTIPRAAGLLDERRSVIL